ncbi:MAG: fluoride efflux transporter CrcB [Betaproteobacteria bacterium]|jgi:CrcB protein
MWIAVFAVATGAALGALARWGLSNALNGVFPHLPAGTLVANLVGGWGIGLAMALFAQMPQLPPEWRLFVITGFLGGLTTFSAFSAEVVTALQQGRTGWALATAGAHLAGSVLMTLLGLATPLLWRR